MSLPIAAGILIQYALRFYVLAPVCVPSYVDADSQRLFRQVPGSAAFLHSLEGETGKNDETIFILHAKALFHLRTSIKATQPVADSPVLSASAMIPSEASSGGSSPKAAR